MDYFLRFEVMCQFNPWTKNWFDNEKVKRQLAGYHLNDAHELAIIEVVYRLEIDRANAVKDVELKTHWLVQKERAELAIRRRIHAMVPLVNDPSTLSQSAIKDQVEVSDAQPGTFEEKGLNGRISVGGGPDKFLYFEDAERANFDGVGPYFRHLLEEANGYRPDPRFNSQMLPEGVKWVVDENKFYVKRAAELRALDPTNAKTFILYKAEFRRDGCSPESAREWACVKLVIKPELDAARAIGDKETEQKWQDVRKEAAWDFKSRLDYQRAAIAKHKYKRSKYGTDKNIIFRVGDRKAIYEQDAREKAYTLSSYIRRLADKRAGRLQNRDFLYQRQPRNLPEHRARWSAKTSLRRSASAVRFFMEIASKLPKKGAIDTRPEESSWIRFEKRAHAYAKDTPQIALGFAGDNEYHPSVNPTTLHFIWEKRTDLTRRSASFLRQIKAARRLSVITDEVIEGWHQSLDQCYIERQKLVQLMEKLLVVDKSPRFQEIRTLLNSD